MLVAFAVVGCSSTDRARTSPAAVAGAPSDVHTARAYLDPPLKLTEWQVTSFREPGGEPVAVTVDARFRMDEHGHASADACNAIGGSYRLYGDTISFTGGGGTTALCPGQRGELDTIFDELFKGTANWSIVGGRLTVSRGDGSELAFRKAASIFPDVGGGAVVLSGSRGTGRYQLSTERHGRIWGATYSYRVAPGAQSSFAGIGSDDIACLADSVIQADWPNGDTFVFGWVTPSVARVVSNGVNFTFHRVPGTDLRIADAWVPGFKPSRTAISWYSRAGTLLAAYPKGPC